MKTRTTIDCKLAFRLFADETYRMANDDQGHPFLSGLGATPTLVVSATAKIDAAEFAAHVHLTPVADPAHPIELQAVSATFEQSMAWQYRVRPAVALTTGVSYELTIDAGLHPLPAGIANDAFAKRVSP